MPKESSADHSWRLALMAFVVAEELKLNIDLKHAVKLALIHDIAEAVTGDIDDTLIAEGKITREEKQKCEIQAIKKLANTLPPKIGKEIYSLWKEFEEGLTKEAKFIRALDKLETLSHLVKTGHKTYGKPGVIPNYADKAVKEFPGLTNVLKIIKRKLKDEFGKGNIPWKKEYDG